MDKRTTITIILLLVAFCVQNVKPIQAQSGLDNNLVACWDFEEPAGPRADSYAFNHWTDNNTVQTTTGVNGAAAMMVSGNSEYLSRNVTDSPLMNPGTTGPFSVSGWFRLDASTGFTLLAEGLNNIDWEISGNAPSGGDVYFYANVNGGSALPFSSAVTIGQWYHLAGTFTGSQATLYLNAVQKATGAFVLTNNVGTLFGVNRRGATYGTVSYDSLAYWNDVLTQDQIADLYNSGAGLSCDDILATGGTGGTIDDGSAIYTVALPSGNTGTVKMQVTAGDTVLALILGSSFTLALFSTLRGTVQRARMK